MPLSLNGSKKKMIKNVKINKLFIITLEDNHTVKHLRIAIVVEMMRLNKINLFDQNQVTFIPQTTRQVITQMMKVQSIAGKINKAILMRLYRRKIKKANIIRSINGLIIVDALTKLKIGLIRTIMFINAIDGMTIKDRLMKQCM